MIRELTAPPISTPIYPLRDSLKIGVYQVTFYTNRDATWLYIKVQEYDRPDRWFILG